MSLKRVPKFSTLNKNLKQAVPLVFDMAINHFTNVFALLENCESTIKYSSPESDTKHPQNGICGVLLDSASKLWRGKKVSEADAITLFSFIYGVTDEINIRLGPGNLWLHHWLRIKGYPASYADLQIRENAIKLANTRVSWLKALKEEFCSESGVHTEENILGITLAN